jgi:hypothetical protein
VAALGCCHDCTDCTDSAALEEGESTHRGEPLGVLPQGVQRGCSDLTATTPTVLGDDSPTGRDRDDNADDHADDNADDNADDVPDPDTTP